MTPVLYDMVSDTDRAATQDDLDRLQRTSHAFGELVKRLKFHVAEVRNGLVKPGAAITEIEQSTRIAEQTAASLDMDQLIQMQGAVHGRHVLVVER